MWNIIPSALALFSQQISYLSPRKYRQHVCREELSVPIYVVRLYNNISCAAAMLERSLEQLSNKQINPYLHQKHTHTDTYVCVCFVCICVHEAWKQWLSFKDAIQGESIICVEELFMSVLIFKPEFVLDCQNHVILVHPFDCLIVIVRRGYCCATKYDK